MNLRSAVSNVAEAVVDTVTGWGIPDNAGDILQAMPAAPKHYSLGALKKSPPMRLAVLEKQVEDDEAELWRLRVITAMGVPVEHPVYRRYEENRATLAARRANRQTISNCRSEMGRQKTLAAEKHAELKRIEAEAKSATGDAAARLYNAAIPLKTVIEGAQYNFELAKKILEQAEGHKKNCGDLD